MTDHIIPLNARSGHQGILGRTGSGKTYTAKTEVEALLKENRWTIIVDPTDAWWGLRSSADGDGEGFPIAIFGGDHADVPITPENGHALAEFLAQERLSAVISLADFSNNGRNKFMTDFLETLRRRKDRTPLYLVLDEADAFAPQRPLPEMRRLAHEVSQVVRRGRVKGFRVIMISQRPATIDKDVLTQVGVLVAMQVTAPQDRKAIEEWVKGQADVEKGRQVLDTLAGLGVGEGWVWAPALDYLERVTFPRISTFDSSKTPEDDDEILEPRTLADVDVAALSKALAPAEKVDDEPVPAASSAKDIAAAHQRGHSEGFEAGYTQGYADGGAAEQKRVLAIMDAASDEIRHGAGQEIPAAPNGKAGGHEGRRQPQGGGGRPPSPPAQSSHGGLPSSALGWLETIRDLEPGAFSWSVLAIIQGKKARGGHFNTLRKAMVEGGYVDDAPQGVRLTEKGLGIVGPPPREQIATISRLKDNLPTLPAEIVRVLECVPTGLTVEAVAAELGKAPRGGHWNTGMRILRDGAVIETDREGVVRLAEWVRS